MIILSSSKLSTCRIKGLGGSSHFKIFGIGEFREFLSFFLGFVEIIINTLDFSVIILALSLFESNSISQPIDFILVSSFLLSVLSKFILKVISIFSQTVSLITLNADLSLKSHAFLLSSTDLVSNGADLRLIFIITPILFIEQEPEVFDFFSKRVD
jgi:hypothetical protein